MDMRVAEREGVLAIEADFKLPPWSTGKGRRRRVERLPLRLVFRRWEPGAEIDEPEGNIFTDPQTGARYFVSLVELAPPSGPGSGDTAAAHAEAPDPGQSICYPDDMLTAAL